MSDRQNRPPPDAAEQAAKDACRALARQLATPEGARTARAHQRAGLPVVPAPGLRLPGEHAEPQPADGAGAAPPPSGLPGIGAPPPGGGVQGAVGAAAAAASPAGAMRRPRPISIWQPRGEGPELVWVRPEPLALGDHFAVQRELRPKRAPLPLRVCLFGESAAAGYLYAPHLTPAGVLAAQLRAVAGEAAAEVIDLARTNETLASLAATIEAAVQIQPDVLVIFAGNNWDLLETPEVSPYAPSVAARQRYAAAWRQAGGLDGPLALAAGRLREQVTALFARIALIARAIGVPVVVVVPEVSLAGWESRQPVHWLAAAAGGGGSTGEDGGESGTRRRPASRSAVAGWYRLLAGGRHDLAAGAWRAAARRAERMLRLDGGHNPTSWRLLARARVGAGDERAAAAAARREIDAAAYPAMAFLGAPRATSLAMDLLRESCRRHGFARVDLPEIFAAHTGSPLPGRRLFLDYCHLTAEGIEVAMAAVAAEVLRLSGIAEGAPAHTASAAPGGAAARTRAASAERTRVAAAGAGELGWRELLRRLPRLAVEPAVEAVARLGAAVHGAHRVLAVGPKAPLLEAWCDAALAASPGIESAMLDLIAARASPLPAVLTPAQASQLATGHRLGLAHGWRWDHVDAEVVEAMLCSLERRGRTAARAEADRLMLAGRGIRAAGTDLLDPPYCLWEPLGRFFPEAMQLADLARRATLRSPWPETGFCLICDAMREVTLEITARLPLPPSPTPGKPWERQPGSRRGTLKIAVGGQPVGEMPLGEAWTRHQLRVPGHLLRGVRNRLTLHWPMPAADGAAALAAALARLDEGIEADLHPVFGELYSVVASPALQ